MNLSNVWKNTTGFFSKLGKRNLIIMGAVLVVGAAFLVSALLASGNTEPIDADPLPGYEGVSGGEGTDGTQEVATSPDEFFASSQVARQRARDEALEVLQTVVDSDESVSAIKDQAKLDISRIALDIEREANIETLVKAKGFVECVAVVTGTTANVIVKTTGELLPNDIAQISEIVYEQAGIHPVDLKIIPKN